MPTTATDPVDDPIDHSPAAEQRRHEQGPLEILKMPDDDNPGLPPEVWPVPPPGYELPR